MNIRTFATLSGIKKLYPTLSNQFLIDLLNQKINFAYIVKGFEYENVENLKDFFDELNLAIVKNYQISFTYNEKQRVANPYKLANISGAWYLLAVEKDTLKHFSISKINNLTTIGKTFTPQEAILNQIAQNQTNWFGKDNIEVVLRVDISKLYYFQRKKLISNQEIYKIKQRYFYLKAKVSFEDEIIRFVSYWIPHIKIIYPRNLQKKLNLALKEYIS